MTDQREPGAEPEPHRRHGRDHEGPAIAPPVDVPPVSAEDLVDGDLPPGGAEERTYPSTIGGAFYLLVLAVTIAGLAVVAFGSWRLGVRLIGVSLLFAAAVRLVLRSRDAGMLAVRNKYLDAVLLTGLGGLLIFLATSIPDQPGL